MLAPGDCSPSLSVVSNIKTRFLLVSILPSLRSNPENKKGHELLEPMAFRYVLFAVDYGLPKNDGRLPLSKRRRRARTSRIALLSELTNAFFMPNVIFRKSF